MAISIVASSLKSRSVRRSIAGGSGLRKIDLTRSIATTGNENFVQKILSGVGKLIGFLSKIGGAISFSFTAATNWLIERTEELKAFDWNATDAELRQSINGYNIQLAAIWGGLVGRGLGYLATVTVGVGIGLFIPVIGGSALATAISGAIATDAVPELLDELGAVLTQTIALKARQATLSAYINVRHLIKRLPIQTLTRLPGVSPNFARKIKNEWGAEGAPVFSFNQVMDDQVEKIKNPITQAFVEEALEESWDTFVEGTFIIANEIDDFIAARELEPPENTLRAIEVLPDKTNPDEKLLFYGRENSLISQVMGTLNTHQAIHGRDIGFYEEGTLSEGTAIAQKRTLRIVFFSAPAPPWRRSDREFKKCEHKIPDPKVSLTWRDVRRAAGGDAGMRVGKFAAKVKFASRRSFTVYGDTKETATANGKRLAELSESPVLKISVSEIVDQKKKPKAPINVYPAFAHIGKAIPDPNSDRQTVDGQRVRYERERITLWTTDPPGNVNTLFN